MDITQIRGTLTNILVSMINFVPGLVDGLVILIVGYLVSWGVRWVIGFVLRHIRFDQVMQHIGITSALQGLGVRAPLSQVVAQVVFFFLILSFATSAAHLMGLEAVSDLLKSVLAFVPKAISGGLIIILGSMLARFLGGAITAVATGVNITYSAALGKVIEYTLVALVVVLSISTLGVDTTILTSSFTIVVATACLAASLTFTIGARDAVRNIIAGFYIRHNFEPDQPLVIGEHRGRFVAFSGAYVVLKETAEDGVVRNVLVPNTMLLHNAITSQTKEATDNTQSGSSEEAGM